MAIGDTEIWRGRHVTRGQFVFWLILQALATGTAVGGCVVYTRNETTANRRSIAQMEIQQQKLQDQQQRQADMQIRGLKEIHDDFDKLFKIIVISDGSKKR